MGNIYYYNINYYCNNDCKFCFSSSTGNNKYSVSMATIISELSTIVRQDDTVVLNLHFVVKNKSLLLEPYT